MKSAGICFTYNSVYNGSLLSASCERWPIFVKREFSGTRIFQGIGVAKNGCRWDFEVEVVEIQCPSGTEAGEESPD